MSMANASSAPLATTSMITIFALRYLMSAKPSTSRRKDAKNAI